MTIAPAERVETSLEEIAALDFDFSPHCEITDCPDKPAAKWSGIPTCGCDKFLCDECKAIVQHWMDEGEFIVCTHCSATSIRVRFEPLRHM